LAKETIKVTIDKQGNATVATENFTGKACQAATKELEVQLGKATSEKFTADYYKPEPDSKTWVTGK